jgi:catechol 2,3-dioxygenase-like lactoylglutathione lyase family enzyme
MKIKQIKETCLYVKDLDRTTRFYHTLLGLEIISRVEGRHVFFRAGTSVLLCFMNEATRNEKNLPPHWGEGRLHMAFEVNLQDYEKWKAKLKQAGIEIIHEQSWKNELTSVYFHDPDGHVLEIVPPGIWE